MLHARAAWQWLIISPFVFAVLIASGTAEAEESARPWKGMGAYRVLASVKTRQKDQGDRRDDMPAALTLDLASELAELGETRRPDIASIQVMRLDGDGRPEVYRDYAHQQSEFDRPFRWYDASIPFEFPDARDAISRTAEMPRFRPRTRGGAFYNVLGEWRSGRLVWMHTDDGCDATYAIYFDVLPVGESPSQLPPRAWLGDGSPRCTESGGSTMGADHCRVDTTDWNGDGLVDLIVGENYGHVVWWPNLGTEQRPQFRYGKLVWADGKPLDAGIGAAPKVVDWDGDGDDDLLVGTHWNRILLYRNIGSNSNRQYQCAGPLLINGKPLEVPFQPLTRGEKGIFKRDYYPVLETCDWDNDGDIDLLAGGYVTGLIFLYENEGSAPGAGDLIPRGPIHADGQPLNVGHWCAAPAVADWDNDGDLDLVTGNMPMYVTPQEQHLHQRDHVQYYENVGGRGTPQLRRREFPGDGEFSMGRLATPRPADWDGDGDLDLVVSSREQIYLIENQGTVASPHFSLPGVRVRCPWGMARLPGTRLTDWNGDTRMDVVSGYTVQLRTEAGNPYAWDKTVSVLPPGQWIAHPSGVGDDWFWPYLFDFDSDGDRDVLFGDWFGHIWLHRNQSTEQGVLFDLEGIRATLGDDSQRLKVGPQNKDVSTDFDALQGARTVFAVGDMDADGRHDLVVGDTYGIIRYFRCLDASQFRFATPVEIGDLGIRGLVDVTDFNGDGKLDVLASAANGKVRLFLNRGDKGGAVFGQGIDLQLPLIEQPRVLIADINGDGDDDMYLPSTQGSCFIERSFLEGGYAAATRIALERRRVECAKSAMGERSDRPRIQRKGAKAQ